MRQDTIDRLVSLATAVREKRIMKPAAATIMLDLVLRELDWADRPDQPVAQ